MKLQKSIYLTLFFCLVFCSESFSASFDGIVRPVHELELAIPLDGVVSEIVVKEGTGVRKGAKLVQLDDTLQRLEVDRKKQIYLDNGEYESNKNNLEILKTLLDSSKQLFESTGSVSLDEVNNLQMQYFNLKGKVEMQESKKKQELIEYEIAKEVLARYVIRSPIDGVVTSIKREEGEWVKTGEVLVVVADKSVCYVDFNLEERYVRGLKKGQAISLHINQGAGSVVGKGVVKFVSPVADKASALVKVRVEFRNKDGKITPGVLASISF